MARSRRASPGPFFRRGGGGGASCVGSTPSRNALMKTPSPRPHRAKFIFTPRQDLHAQIGSIQVEQMDISHQTFQSTTALPDERQRVKDRVRPRGHPRVTRITPRVRALVPLGLTTDNLRQVQFKVRNTRELQNLGKDLVAMVEDALRLRDEHLARAHHFTKFRDVVRVATRLLVPPLFELTVRELLHEQVVVRVRIC